MNGARTGGTRVALEVTVRWGDDVLATRRLSGGEAVIGAARGAIAAVPCAGLGRDALAVARVARGRATASVPEGCVAEVRQGDATGSGSPLSGARLVAGPAEVPLGAGEALTLWIAGFQIAIAAAPDAPPPWAGAAAARSLGALPHVAFAAVVHAAAIGVGAGAALAADLTDDPAAQPEAMRGYLAAAERRASAPDPVKSGQTGATDGERSNQRAGNGKPGGGQRAAGEEGAMGSRLSRTAAPARFALSKREAGDPALAEARALDEARDFGMIGLLASGGEHAPAAAFGELAARGPDALAADGAMWARALGEQSGAEGLGLSGVGLGGGGSGLGVGLDRVGTVGHTSGIPGPGTGGGGTPLIGMGLSGWRGSWHSSHRARGIRGRWGYGHGASVIGRLPPETIQRIIRQNFGRFRACYEAGLRPSPNLQGRVTVHFVIGRDGAVASAQDRGSSLPDAQVVSCVVRAFYGISFPQPEGGIVNVTYPIVFSPGE